jgi:pyruvate dehydrogenase E2 component (dihydrolipoamide acetyltransferase)
MRKEVTMPRMGQSMDEGRVLHWLKEMGSEVKRGEVIAEIETDKAVVEMEAFVTGRLVEIVVPEGELVPTGTVIAYIDDGRPEPEPASSTPTSAKLPETVAPPAIVEGAKPTQRAERINASPVAKRLAEEHGIDLAQVKGTGPDGRIGKADVEAWLEVQRKDVPTSVPEEIKRVSLSKIKQTTARRMQGSKTTAPHFYVSMDIEMSQALALRDWLKARGRQVSINDLILKATALALTKYPHLNATFAGDELNVHPHVNLAVAVDLDDGLITPVIHHCESRSLAEIATAAKQLVERARSGRLRPDDLEGGTFTVSNLGMFGVKHFEAIINPPQAAILTAGAVRRVPVFDTSDRVVPAQLLTATVSADHRVTDGAEVARFLQELKATLEAGFILMLDEPFD